MEARYKGLRKPTRYTTDAGIFITALRVSSTIIPMVLDGYEFWLLLLINTTVCVVRHQGLFNPEKYGIDVPYDLTGVTGSLMTFFVCFYNSHMFARYNRLYEVTQRMFEVALEIVATVRVQFPDSRGLHTNIARLVIASCWLYYFERSSQDESDENTPHGVSGKEFQGLQRSGLLTNDEIKQIHAFGAEYGEHSLTSLMVTSWAMEYARNCTSEPESRDDMLASLYSSLYELRQCQACVTQIMAFPMPFQYFHIMNLMLMLNLALWAYALGCENSYVAPVIYMFVQMMFQGVRELSTALSDPFGDDEVDFPLNFWLMALQDRVKSLAEETYSIDKCTVTARPLIDPRRASRKINLLVDFGDDGGVRAKSWARRKMLARKAVSPPETRSLLALPGWDPEADALSSKLEMRRLDWGWEE